MDSSSRGLSLKQGTAVLILIVCAAGCGGRRDIPADAKASQGNLSAFSDCHSQSPGRVHHIRIADLPDPYATPSVDNAADLIPRPSDAWPQAPPGFRVQLYACGLQNPRLIRMAPSGDVFLAESAPGTIRVFRGIASDGHARQSEVFATGLQQPFGIAFYPPGPDPDWVYVANTGSIVRFPYRNGDLRARGAYELISSAIPGGGLLRGGGHWTRDIAFSQDGKKMFVSVGSRSDDAEILYTPVEDHRANILELNPDGSALRVYAWGIRNPVGIAIQPGTGGLWASVNERDRLGDNLVPDYITHVREGGFYGWPWFYMGGYPDPRHRDEHPELKDKVITPDVLLQSHNASLEMTFYEGKQFPAEFQGDIFAAQHGSWNRQLKTGYEVIRVPLHGIGQATGEYEDFLTGFITADGRVWGRPVGVTVASDGSLLVSDDGSRCIWRVTYTGKADPLR
jgi:glucose/arabinose dehydrogenase